MTSWGVGVRENTMVVVKSAKEFSVLSIFLSAARLTNVTLESNWNFPSPMDNVVGAYLDAF